MTLLHTDGEDCPCTPTVISVACDNGSTGRVTAHREPDMNPAQQADRAAAIAEAIDAVRREPAEKR